LHLACYNQCSCLEDRLLRGASTRRVARQNRRTRTREEDKSKEIDAYIYVM
jgi:hypothetical protein